MKVTINLLTSFIILICLESAFGQTTYSMCYIHSVNSQNNKFSLKTIPFDNIEQTPTGITTVFNSDHSKVYEIQRYFEIEKNRKELFISNDGNTLIYVINKEFSWDGIQYKSVEIFKNGNSFKKYALTDFIKCNPDYEDCFFFYKEAIDSIKWENGKRKIQYKENATNFEKKLTENALYFNNDSLYIFAKTSKLITIDLHSTNFTITPLSEVNENWINQLQTIKINSEKLKPSSLYGLPSLAIGKTFEKGIAQHLNMAIFPEDSKNENYYKRYSLYLEILVDNNGNATLEKIENYGGLSEKSIKSFIESYKFETTYIPKEAEKWRFTGWVQFRNRSKKKAKREREQEIIEEDKAYEKRIVADSINGLYIPKNLEECFLELNKLLKPKDIEAIKNLKDRNETISYHHGFGTWLRNNWGLWGGSRLQQYLRKKGIDHPDSMSSLILQYYYDWLHGQNDQWKEFEAK